ncbi:MAG: hypothetical protein ACREYE_17200 [Gammaproteobacteria bacterium]
MNSAEVLDIVSCRFRSAGRTRLAEEVRIEGTEGLALHHLYRVLALLLERMAEAACADTWRNIRNDLKRIKLAQLLSPKETVWQVTEPPTDPRMHSST